MKTALERVDWMLGEVMRQLEETVDAPGNRLVDRQEMGRAFIGVLHATRMQIVDILIGRDDGGDHQGTG